MNFLAKIRQTGLTFPNIASWLSLKAMFFSGKFFGTLFLHIKAALFGVKLGKNVVAHGKVGLLCWPGGKISVGSNVSIISSWRRSTACAIYHPTRLRVFGKGAEIMIMDGCQISGASITARSKSIKIGRNVLLGPNCIIADSDFHVHWPPEKRADDPGYEHDAPVCIGDFVWIGMNVIILKGVTIGNGAIIGAGSVVTRDIPENSIACGIPAKAVKKNYARG